MKSLARDGDSDRRGGTTASATSSTSSVSMLRTIRATHDTTPVSTPATT